MSVISNGGPDVEGVGVTLATAMRLELESGEVLVVNVVVEGTISRICIGRVAGALGGRGGTEKALHDATIKPKYPLSNFIVYISSLL